MHWSSSYRDRGCHSIDSHGRHGKGIVIRDGRALRLGETGGETCRTDEVVGVVVAVEVGGSAVVARDGWFARLPSGINLQSVSLSVTAVITIDSLSAAHSNNMEEMDGSRVSKNVQVHILAIFQYQ